MENHLKSIYNVPIWKKINMANLIKPGSVKVVTQEGEIQVIISLDLNLNINYDNIKVQAQTILKESEEVKKEDNNWMVPEFFSSDKIEFGKKV